MHGGGEQGEGLRDRGLQVRRGRGGRRWQQRALGERIGAREKELRWGGGGGVTDGENEGGGAPAEREGGCKIAGV